MGGIVRVLVRIDFNGLILQGELLGPSGEFSSLRTQFRGAFVCAFYTEIWSVSSNKFATTFLAYKVLPSVCAIGYDR